VSTRRKEPPLPRRVRTIIDRVQLLTSNNDTLFLGHSQTWEAQR
jgi:hypothetical protein